MQKESPNHHDAEIVLKLYELRRETQMRDSRNEMLAKFWPRSYDDFFTITDMKHPMNQAFRQFTSYWEMAYGFARHGVINADFLVETNGGEGIFFYAKIKPYLEQFRKQSPIAFQNVEWICQNSNAGKTRLAMMEKRVKDILDSMRS